jgi:hypothetical protein
MLPLVLGLLIAFVFLQNRASTQEEANDVTNFALGNNNGIPPRRVDDILIHFREKPDFQKDVDECLKGYSKSGLDALVLWLGNSQSHAINQMQDGQETAAMMVHRRMLDAGEYVIAGSLNNANLQEHYAIVEFLLTRVDIQTIVLPAVFDDMREAGTRDEISSIFDDPDAVANLRKNELGQRFVSSAAATDSAGNEMAALDETVQRRVEEYLNSKLAARWKVWDQRAALRSKAFLFNYQLRNWALRIDPTSQRRMIPAYYADNRMAFEMILSAAKQRGIQVIPYIVPLRYDVAIPYDEKQYLSFKEDLTDLAAQYGFEMRNLEKLVPSEYWGTKNATSLGGDQELDFMHFQFGGHRLLADAIEGELLELGGNLK